MSILIRPMCFKDLDGVLQVEELAFSMPWSRAAFESELQDNSLATYVVLEDESQIVGYAGFWRILDEGHITNVAILPEFRGRGLGSKLLACLINEATTQKITAMTLEVRRSNQVAQKLYEKFGFAVQGVRKRYYQDNHEDALIMWAPIKAEKKAPAGAKG